MTANELRIGNIINDMGSRAYIVDAYEIVILSRTAGGKKNISFNPILLTPEWLLKFGFGKYDGGLLIRLREMDRALDWDAQTGLYLVCLEDENNTIELEHIKHVHQLQNLYFALTGEELKIVC